MRSEPWIFILMNALQKQREISGEAQQENAQLIRPSVLPGELAKSHNRDPRDKAGAFQNLMTRPRTMAAEKGFTSGWSPLPNR